MSRPTKPGVLSLMGRMRTAGISRRMAIKAITFAWNVLSGQERGRNGILVMSQHALDGERNGGLMASSIQSGRHMAENVALTESVFRDVCLGRARFEDVNLAGAVFADINLSGARFSDVNLSGVEI